MKRPILHLPAHSERDVHGEELPQVPVEAHCRPGKVVICGKYERGEFREGGYPTGEGS